MKTKRQSKILELIENNSIDTQEELTETLRGFGFEVTQATVSRDIKELRLVKILSDDGRYKYFHSLSNERVYNSNLGGKFFGIFKEGVLSVDFALNLVVVKCFSGMANAVCAAIDASNNSSIVGTLAGDDTIFIALRNEESAVGLVDELNKILSIKGE